jgi:riboflavin kinase/FMN adenylyltransferase
MKPVNLKGTVTRFKGNGRRLGYPTANLVTKTDLADGVYFGFADLADGVYFGFADLADWSQHPAMVFIGVPTTVGDTNRRAEVHLLDIPDRDYYDLPLIVSIRHYHRANQTFNNVDELLEAMKDDEAKARQWFEDNPQ